MTMTDCVAYTDLYTGPDDAEGDEGDDTPRVATQADIDRLFL